MARYLYLPVILALMVTAACLGGSQEQTSTETAAPTKAPAAVGSEIYRISCQPCHAVNGAGVGLPNQPDFRDASFWASKSDSELINTIKNGRGQMPAWKDRLSEDEIKAVVGYVKNFAK